MGGSLIMPINFSGSPSITRTTSLSVNGSLNVSGDIASNTDYVVTASLSANKTANNASDTPILFDYIKNDPNLWVSVFGLSATRITPTVPGYYFISYQIAWQPGTAGSGNQNNIQILRTGSAVALTQQPINGTASVNTFLNANAIVYLNGSTDYLTFQAYSSNSAQVIVGTLDGAWSKVEAYKIN